MAILDQGEETSLGPVLSDVITEALFFRNRRVPSGVIILNGGCSPHLPGPIGQEPPRGSDSPPSKGNRMSLRPALSVAILLVCLLAPQIVLSDEPFSSVDGTKAVASTLGRVTFTVPPERMDEFKIACSDEFLPTLEKHGFVKSTLESRSTVDSVFSQLYVFSSPEDLLKKSRALQNEPSFRYILIKKGTWLESTQPENFLPIDFSIYSTPGLPGKVVESGPGKSEPVVEETECWQT